MNDYLVTWDIQVNADNPEDAARKAREAQHSNTLALFFLVTNSETGDQTQVDLLEDQMSIYCFTPRKPTEPL